MHIAVFLLFLGFLPLIAIAEEKLDTIIVEGSASDALLYDPIVPTRRDNVEGTSSGGSLESELFTKLPTPMTDYGMPGGTSQVRGFGRTADDTNVQALGVPLNAPQGGGFDFASFPQFFWSSYQIQIGSGMGAFDPHAPSGTISLSPWTASALDQKNNSYRVSESITRGLSQSSAAAGNGNAAVLAGYSGFNATGPTASISGKLYKSDSLDARAHLLFTSIDELSPGSQQYPTPKAHYKTERWIPVMEIRTRPIEDLLVKESLFYDHNQQIFSNPANTLYNTDDHANQEGSETAAFYHDWRFGLSFRQAAFHQISFNPPAEFSSHLQVAKTFHATEATTLDFSLQADNMSTVGFKPGAAAGWRYDFNPSTGIFFKSNYGYRFPTIQDRYYNLSGFLANPSLRPEREIQANPGIEVHFQDFSTTLQGILQYRRDAQILIYNSSIQLDQVQNSGDVKMTSLLHDISWQPIYWMDLTNSFRLSASNVEALDSRVPYDPLVTETFRFGGHGSPASHAWSAGISGRAVTQSPYAVGINNPGYLWLNLDAGFHWGDFLIQGRIDNLANRPIQIVSGYPAEGRLYSLSVIGLFGGVSSF